MNSTNLNKGILFNHIDSVNICICYFFIYVAIAEFIDLFDGALFIVRRIINVFYVLFFFNALPALFRRLKEKKIHFYLFIAIYSLAYLISFLSTTDLKLHGLVLRELIRFCLCMFLLGSSVINTKDLISKLRFSGLILLLLYILQFFVFSTYLDFFGYSQDVGYNCLLCLSVFYILFLIENNYLYLLITVFSFVFIFISGARGPLLCGVLICIVGYILIKEIRLSKLIPFFIVGVLLLTFYNIYKNEILGFSYNILKDNGLSVRTIEKLMDNSIGDDSDREYYRKLAWDYIINNFFYGTGAINDRVYLYSFVKYLSPTQTVYGSYCHNVILEILMQYGMFPGTIFIISLFTCILRVFLNAKEQYFKAVLLVALSVGLFPLLVSRSYFTFSPFYFFMGLMFSRYMKSHNKFVYAQSVSNK